MAWDRLRPNRTGYRQELGLSLELIESVAQSLGVDPEFFLEYRLGSIEEWLCVHPNRTDELFRDLCLTASLIPYTPWAPRLLPDPMSENAGQTPRGPT